MRKPQECVQCGVPRTVMITGKVRDNGLILTYKPLCVPCFVKHALGWDIKWDKIPKELKTCVIPEED